MPLTGPRDMFAKALAGGFAVGAFNINNMETVQGILQAAGDERSPVILQVSNGARQYAGRGYLRKMAEAASDRGSWLPWARRTRTPPASRRTKASRRARRARRLLSALL